MAEAISTGRDQTGFEARFINKFIGTPSGDFASVEVIPAKTKNLKISADTADSVWVPLEISPSADYPSQATNVINQKTSAETGNPSVPLEQEISPSLDCLSQTTHVINQKTLAVTGTLLVPQEPEIPPSLDCLSQTTNVINQKTSTETGKPSVPQEQEISPSLDCFSQTTNVINQKTSAETGNPSVSQEQEIHPSIYCPSQTSNENQTSTETGNPSVPQEQEISPSLDCLSQTTNVINQKTSAETGNLSVSQEQEIPTSLDCLRQTTNVINQTSAETGNRSVPQEQEIPPSLDCPSQTTNVINQKTSAETGKPSVPQEQEFPPSLDCPSQTTNVINQTSAETDSLLVQQELTPDVLPVSLQIDQSSTLESDQSLCNQEERKEADEETYSSDFSRRSSDEEFSLSPDTAKNCIDSLYREADSTCMNNDTEDSLDGAPQCKTRHSDDIIHSGIHMSAIEQRSYVFRKGVKYVKKHKRVFNKSSACLYCQDLFTNISKHYKTAHKKEAKVVRIIALKETGQSSRETKILWELLRNQGNHKHNKIVIENKEGELLVVRRKKGDTFCSSDYTPCPRCYGWYLKSALTIHVNYRCLRRESERMRSSSALVRSTQQRSTEPMDRLDSEIFCTMRKDHITEVAKGDRIIRKAGEYYFSKHSRNKLRRKNFCSKHMRAAAGLLIRAREISHTSGDLESFLIPQMFNVVQEAAICMAGGQANNSLDVPHPGTLKNIGYDIKHLVEIKEEMAITNADSQKLKEAEYFMKLYYRKWKLLAGAAQKQLEERNYNKNVELPSCTDLQQITQFVKGRLEMVSSSSKQVSYAEVVEIVQSRLILFNKRRPGELEALRLEDFAKRGNNDTVLSDVVKRTLSELEQKLLSTHEVVTVRGKRGNAVPIIIPPDSVTAMTLLQDKTFRKAAGVKDSNTYMFANTGDEVFRAVSSLKNVLKSAGCSEKVASQIKASNLRKYLATNCQLMNLSDSELDWVVRHLGHTKLTHMQNYRLSSSTIERTKVAKLLVLMENGMLDKAQGSSLNDKALDDLILNKMNGDDEVEEEIDTQLEEHVREDSVMNIAPPPHEEMATCDNGAVSDNEDFDNACGNSNQAITDSEADVVPSDEETSDEETSDEDSEEDEPPQKVSKPFGRRKNKIWTEEAVRALQTEFSEHLKVDSCGYPSFSVIRQKQKKYPLWLGGRSEAQIKAKLAHLKNLKSRAKQRGDKLFIARYMYQQVTM